jgi:DNA-binding response OmpR family regulator
MFGLDLRTWARTMKFPTTPAGERERQRRLLMKRILLVYDDPRSMVILRRILEPAGYHVTTVPFGPLVLGVIRRTKPGLVVLDVCRERQTGETLCRQIRLESESVPLLILSVAGDPVLMLQLGADGFMTKPFNGYELLARVRTAIRQQV